jgi:hypothetical protein
MLVRGGDTPVLLPGTGAIVVVDLWMVVLVAVVAASACCRADGGSATIVEVGCCCGGTGITDSGGRGIVVVLAIATLAGLSISFGATSCFGSHIFSMARVTCSRGAFF